jgi:hypothetical protein
MFAVLDVIECRHGAASILTDEECLCPCSLFQIYLWYGVYNEHPRDVGKTALCIPRNIGTTYQNSSTEMGSRLDGKQNGTESTKVCKS